ncbi:MAG: RraA family protein [Promethearchaeota archaeon]
MNIPNILQKLRLTGTAALSDAKGGRDVLDCRIKLCSSDEGLIAGVAETVHILQKSLSPIRALFNECKKRSGEKIIIVIDASGIEGAVWGEIFTRYAMESSIIGCVIDGGVRDISVIKSLKFPIWARYVTPRVITGEWATTFSPGFELGESGQLKNAVVCGGVLIRHGDFVLADMDGVIVIRQEEVQGVLQKAEEIQRMEEVMMEELQLKKKHSK